jgi:plastocyanin
MLSKRAGLWLGLIATLGLLSLGSSCGGTKTEDTANDGGSSTGAAYASKGDEGSITGTIAFTGEAPANPKIDTSADAQCTSKSPNLTAETWEVKDAKVANTFVYIKDGTLADGKKIGDYTFAAPTAAATLDQNGCHYKPHVLGVMARQEINITNSDPTTHNIHFLQGKNPDWNQSQPNGAPALKHSLNAAEQMAQVKCNQHPWMKAYVGVMKHPFFAVSDETGKFTISAVPPGKYTVVAWHEGATGPGTEKTMEVTVPAKGPATADFSFGATAGLQGQPSSLPMVAVQFPMLHK